MVADVRLAEALETENGGEPRREHLFGNFDRSARIAGAEFNEDQS
jgi:hypothetical protein